MSIGLTRMTEDAMTLADRSRILPALELLERARSMTRIPSRRLFLTYNIGVLYWDRLGDGMSARREFLAAADMHGPDLDHPDAQLLRANALENLMLCAASFEEFDRFTAELRAMAPRMPVVLGLPPSIHKIREHASPWSTALIQLAMNNYNRSNPAQDRGRYGVAKSTYHVLLATRKQQRLSGEDWRLVIFEYCALALRMTNDCQHRRGGDADANSPEEFLPMLADALPYADEYLGVYTGDVTVKETRNGMRFILDNSRRRWAVLSPGGGERTSPLPVPVGPEAYRCRRCRTHVPDLVRPCPACGAASPLAGLVLLLSVMAIVANVAAWFLAAAQSPLARASWGLAATACVYVVIGPIVFHFWVERLKR
jgi:hypothetical protein